MTRQPPGPCQASGCPKKAVAKKYCGAHYFRWSRTGDPFGSMRKSPEMRFWSKVAKGDDKSCWTWTGAKHGSGYGVIYARGKDWLAHRFSYELAFGTIPPGLQIDHTCHNDTDCAGGKTCLHRQCVNPAHLEAVEPRENRSRSHLYMSKRTHCPRGHEYTPENTRVNSLGSRGCIACQRLKDKQRRSSPGVPAKTEDAA